MNRVSREISFEGFCRYLHYLCRGLYCRVRVCAAVDNALAAHENMATCTKIKGTVVAGLQSGRVEKLAKEISFFSFFTETAFGPCTACRYYAQSFPYVLTQHVYVQT